MTAEMQSDSDFGRRLQPIAERLVREFDGRIAADIVESCLLEAYEAFAKTATVHLYLGIFAERTARDRLRSLALSSSPPARS
jgi:DNA-directed RNA polymerase specialized sigma24 family protein